MSKAPTAGPADPVGATRTVTGIPPDVCTTGRGTSDIESMVHMKGSLPDRHSKDLSCLWAACAPARRVILRLAPSTSKRRPDHGCMATDWGSDGGRWHARRDPHAECCRVCAHFAHVTARIYAFLRAVIWSWGEERRSRKPLW